MKLVLVRQQGIKDIKQFLEAGTKKGKLKAIERDYMQEFVNAYGSLEKHVKEEKENLEQKQKHIDEEQTILNNAKGIIKIYKDQLQKNTTSMFHVY